MKAVSVALAASCATLLGAGAAEALTCPAGQHVLTVINVASCVPDTPEATRTVTITNMAGLLIRADIGKVDGGSTIAGYYGTKSYIPIRQSYTLQVPQNVTVWVEADYWDTKESQWESVPHCRDQVGPGSSSITFTAYGTSDGEAAGTSMTMHCNR
jgi:hypothetical protein